MCNSQNFAAHQRVPVSAFQAAALQRAPQEQGAPIWPCAAGACGARQHGDTEENELAEQLCSELLSSSGSITGFNLDGAAADAAAALAHAAAALAALLCHEGCPEEAAASIAEIFPGARAISVHCPTASCTSLCAP